jgi:glycosyltransferase involved in cell wall biosynthesis
VFIRRRLAALAEFTPVSVIQPVPYFPFWRPRKEWMRRIDSYNGALVERVPMFHVPGLARQLNPWWLARSVRRAAQRHASRGSIVLDAHFGFPEGVGVLRVGQEIGVPTVLTLHGVEQAQIHSPRTASALTAAIRSADGVICVSRALRQMAVECGADPMRVRVIPNGVDPTLFSPTVERASAKRAVGCRPDDELVVCVANLLRVKDHELLLRAFSRARSHRPRLALALVGGETHERGVESNIRHWAARLGVEAAVKLVGRVHPDEVPAWLHAADVFALTSVREGCSTALVEAIACGVPAVVTDVGDNGHYVETGVNGYVTRSREPGEFAVRLLDALRLERPAVVRPSKSRPLTWRQVAEVTVEFFDRVARETAAGPATTVRHSRREPERPVRLARSAVRATVRNSAVPSGVERDSPFR